jgi:hypothetical protein
MKRSKGLVAPAFQSDDEEFEFWETHDVEDYLTGEKVPLSSIIGAVPAPTSPDLVVTLRLRRGIEDRAPLSRHFGVAIPPELTDRDFGVLFHREALPRGLDCYLVDYRRSESSWGSSGPPIRELMAELNVSSTALAEQAAELIATRVNGARGGARQPSPAALPRRLQRIIGSIARWLREYGAVPLTDEQAEALLHP